MATDRENRVAGTDQYERDFSGPCLVLSLSHSLSLFLVVGRYLPSFSSFASERARKREREKEREPGTMPRETPPARVRPFPREKTHARTHIRVHRQKRNNSWLPPRGEKVTESGGRGGRKNDDESTQKAKGENENVARNSLGTCSESLPNEFAQHPYEDVSDEGELPGGGGFIG
nr:PREDICTED: uncharacterized protein LOC105663933 [Megachile rotundata]